ncbi:MAG: peptidase M13, partial [Flavobacteriaceae bacterium]|nr:peptidase M13 [Flavobacteriaceae bacterium]
MMKKIVYGILAVAFLSVASCKSDGKEEKELTSGVLTQYMDTLVKPGDNFTAYVNGTWVKNTPIPDDKASYGVGYIVHEESEENVKKIIEESSEGDFPAGSDEQKVGDLFKSYTDFEKRNEIGASPLQPEFDKVDALENYDDLAQYFAYANKMGINVPLALFVYQDFKNPTIYTVYTWQSGLGLPDREYYLKDDERSKEIQAKYLEHIEKMLTLTGLPDASASASAIMNLETTLAEKHLEKEKTRDLVSLYNMFPVDTLSNIMPQFNWTAFLGEAGLAEQDKLGVLMLDYTKSLDNIITSTDLDTWKTYLKWSVVDAYASRLNEEMDKQNWDFYSKELRGTKEQRPLWRRGVSVVNGTMGEVVGKVYVKKHFPPEAKERMETLVDNLMKAY